MQFVTLIYAAPDAGPQPGTPEFGELMQGYMAFTQNVRENGKLVAGEALQGTETATTVLVRDGKTETMDGPFAETKEQLSGFYVLECADIDEAVALAAQIPTAEHGRIEVRPVETFD